MRWGAGPRASQYLTLGAKVRAALQGHSVASPEDVAAVAHAVLGHRIQVTFAAEAEGVNSSTVVDRLLEAVSA